MDDIKPKANKRGEVSRAGHRVALSGRGSLLAKTPPASRAHKLVSGLGRLAANRQAKHGILSRMGKIWPPSFVSVFLLSGLRRLTNNSYSIKLQNWAIKLYRRVIRTSFVRQLRRERRYQIYSGLVLVLFLLSLGATIGDPWVQAKPYQLNDAARAVLPRQNDSLTKFLEFDGKSGAYEYNKAYTGTNTAENGLSGTGTPRVNATMSKDPTKGVTVKDPLNNLEVTLKPKFRLQEGKQDKNQILYRLGGTSGYLVYTSQITGVKEDILLGSYSKDKMTFEYELGLPGGVEARKEANGSIGIYGSDLPLNGDVSTGSDKDKELLEKARQKSTKNKLLFTLPAPVVVETNKTVSDVKAHFELDGKVLRVVAEKLKGASYPLSIDPSIYVETAQRLMRGNNETNLDFDVTNELIQKGKLTGARFNSWTSSLALPVNRQGHATAVYGGYVYAIGGNSGSGATGTVYWAKLNTTTGAIEAPNPGNGACASWCTSSSYDLPSAAVREAHSLVAYNGYLYVMGGKSGTTFYDTVYIAKLGLNGEPSLWHPTDPVQANWTYWYTGGVLPATRAYSGAVAYNNKMYLLAGQATNNTAPVTTVHAADMNPNGTLGTWSTTGMVALTGNARMGHSIQVYNNYLYVIGGASTTSAVQSTVLYMKLNSDGTMAGTAWATTTGFTTARTAWGGNISTIWGGYMYLYGGCKVISSSNCSSTADLMSDVQIASINADGSVSDWQTVVGLTSTARSSYGFVAWRGTLYAIGGCTAITAAACSTTIAATERGAINQDGEASAVRDSNPVGTGTCTTDSTSRDCDLPPAGDGNGDAGNMSGAVIVNNGFIYYLGGCTEANNGSVCYNASNVRTSDNIIYAAVRSDGVIVRVAATACDEGSQAFVGNWCVENTSGRRLPVTLAAFGATVFNNTIYIVGGTTGTTWQSNIYRNTPLSDGSLGSWSAAQTFANLGINDTVGTTPTAARGYSYVFTRSNPTLAGTYPGNLYILGGCAGAGGATDNGINCQRILGPPNPVFSSVWKCNIKPDSSLEELDTDDCDTANQLQIDAEPGQGGNQGLGTMAGALYANYIYLVGGQSTNENDRGQIIYAKIDNNNNIVAVSGGIWTTSSNSLSPARRRGVAFGYNGYLYAMAGYADGTALNDLLFSKINTSDGSIGTWSTSAVTVTLRWDLRVMVNNGYVYTLGGCSAGAPPSECTAMTRKVQVFQLYNNYSGAPKLYEYQNVAGYPGGQNAGFAGDRLGHGSAVVNGYLYVAGGCTGLGDCTVVSDQVSYSKINAFGYLAAWTNSSGIDGWRLPSARGWTQLEAAGGSLYIIAGQTSLATLDTVSYTAPNASTGAITSWTSTTALPEARSKFGATVWNNRIYVVGGNSTTADATAKATVYYSNDLSGGGAVTSWTTNATNFNVARSGAAAISYANNLYVLGGATTTSVITGDVQFGKIAADGSISGWTYTSSLPDKLYGADGFAYNGFMYLFGGKASAEVCETNTVAAPISANTTIDSGNNPTGLGEWFETNEKYIGSRYGASSAYYEGKLFLTGGACNSTLTYVPAANKVAQTTLLMQPQVASYSRMIDTDTDVFPKTWLLNGLDNSIGARWQAKYRSMHDLDGAAFTNPNEDCGTSATMPQMTTWGQETNVGNVTLGKVEPYTAKNSTGGNINCARYYFMYLTIDSSQAYGYPEDVSRGPTIADLTLYFAADPSKRLHHGKTFTGGEQQPLDTPCRDSDGNPNNNPDAYPIDDACPAP